MSNFQGNIQYNKSDANYPSNQPLNNENSNYSGKQQLQDANSKKLSHQGTMKGIQSSNASDPSQGGIKNNDNYQKSTSISNNNANNRNKGISGAATSAGGSGQMVMDSSNITVGYNSNQIKQQQLSSQAIPNKEEDSYNGQQNQINMSNKHLSSSQSSQGQHNMDIENQQNIKVNQHQIQNQNTSSSSITGVALQSGSGLQQQQGQSQSSANQGQSNSTNVDPSLAGKQTPAIDRIFAQDVIINFKKHLQDKWKKNKAKQHVNKIIHYHVQHTFFLRYAAPLFLKDYQELLNQNLASAGSNSNNREQGLISTLKQINQDILNGSKKTKSVDVLQSYLAKLEDKDQLNQFLDVLVFILFGETPYQIPSELNERKKNLFHYVSPIIAFLIIFYIHAEKKPITLDELVTRSGLKQLYKNIKVPCKDSDMDDPNAANANDSEEDEDDEMIDEDGDSIQNSGPQNQNTQLATSKQQASNTSQQQSSSQQKASQGNTGAGPSLKKKNSSHPNNNDGIKNEEDDGNSNQEDKSQSGMRSTPQFLDLEKTLMQQKQQMSQQIQSSQQNIYNQGSNSSTINSNMNINIQKKNSVSSNSSMILGQQQQPPNGMMSSQGHHHHHHHHHHPLNQNSSKGINSHYQVHSQQNKQLTNPQQHYYNKPNMSPGNYQLNH